MVVSATGTSSLDYPESPGAIEGVVSTGFREASRRYSAGIDDQSDRIRHVVRRYFRPKAQRTGAMSVAVVVDDREPEHVVAGLRAHPDVDAVTVRRLDAGDVVVGDVGFERKTAGDYLGSVLGRTGTDLEGQVAAMAEAYDRAYVLVEADLAELEAQRPGLNGSSVRGSLASITARSGVPVIPCGDGERLVDLAVRLARKHVESPAVRALSPGAVPVRNEPVAKRMYGCIEGIGPGTAESLYEVFPTVAALLDASREDLLAVDGVGPARADAVYAALRSDE